MTSVSIFVLTCDRPDWAREALTSVLAQTFTEFTVLVRDNSKDDLIEQLVTSLNDSRLRYHRGFPAGQLPNLLGAIAECGGDIVVPMHDDDWWEPTLLESIIKPMLADDTIDLSFASLAVASGSGKNHPKLTAAVKDLRYRGLADGRNDFSRNRLGLADLLLVRQGVSPFQGCAMRREVLEDLDIPVESARTPDLWMCYSMWPYVNVIYFHPEALVHYRIHGGSVAGQIEKMLADSVWCVSKMLQDQRLGGVHRALRRRVLQDTLTVAYGKLARGDVQGSREMLSQLAPSLAISRRAFNLGVSHLPTRPLAQAYLRMRNPRG
jgi:glycosyltransferase involved in cell wall biosynthesis